MPSDIPPTPMNLLYALSRDSIGFVEAGAGRAQGISDLEVAVRVRSLVSSDIRPER
jgi:hypothetical protein